MGRPNDHLRIWLDGQGHTHMVRWIPLVMYVTVCLRAPEKSLLDLLVSLWWPIRNARVSGSLYILSTLVDSCIYIYISVTSNDHFILIQSKWCCGKLKYVQETFKDHSCADIRWHPVRHSAAYIESGPSGTETLKALIAPLPSVDHSTVLGMGGDKYHVRTPNDYTTATSTYHILPEKKHHIWINKTEPIF